MSLAMVERTRCSSSATARLWPLAAITLAGWRWHAIWLSSGWGRLATAFPRASIKLGCPTLLARFWREGGHSRRILVLASVTLLQLGLTYDFLEVVGRVSIIRWRIASNFFLLAKLRLKCWVLLRHQMPVTTPLHVSLTPPWRQR